MTKKIIIIGAGLSGLACATRLQAAGYQPQVLEAGPRVGGHVRSDICGEFLLERGPNSFIASARDVFTWIEELGLEDELLTANPEAAKRYIVKKGALHMMPTGAWTFLTTPLLNLKSKCMLMTEPLRTGQGMADDTAQIFFERRFGKEAARVLAGAFISGVYAGDPAQLSASAAFPLFWHFEQQYGSMIRGAYYHLKQREKERQQSGAPKRRGMYSMRHGLGVMAERAAIMLNGQCYLNTPALNLERLQDSYQVAVSDGRRFAADAVVVAAPPVEAAALLQGVDAGMSAKLAAMQMAPIVVMHLALSLGASEGLPQGYGFLAPRGEGVRTLGILLSSAVFNDRAPRHCQLLTAFVGGMMDPEVLALDDAELVALVTNDLAILLKQKPDLSLLRIERHHRAVPQLMVGHEKRLAALGQSLQNLPGLVLAGNYLTGVGIKDAVGSGFQAASQVAEYLKSKS